MTTTTYALQGSARRTDPKGRKGFSGSKSVQRNQSEDGGRHHVSIPKSLALRLEEIRLDTHASTLTEVLKDALTLYAAAVEEHKQGGRIYFKRADDSGERQLALFI